MSALPLRERFVGIRKERSLRAGGVDDDTQLVAVPARHVGVAGQGLGALPGAPGGEVRGADGRAGAEDHRAERVEVGAGLRGGSREHVETHPRLVGEVDAPVAGDGADAVLGGEAADHGTPGGGVGPRPHGGRGAVGGGAHAGREGPTAEGAQNAHSAGRRFVELDHAVEPGHGAAAVVEDRGDQAHRGAAREREPVGVAGRVDGGLVEHDARRLGDGHAR